MAVTNSDLLLVQRGATPMKAEASALSTYIKGDIEGSDINIASASELGVIRVGANLTIDANGVLSAEMPAGIEYQGTWSNANAAPADLQNGYFWVWDGGNGSTLNSTSWGTANGSTIDDGDQLMYNGSQFDIIPGGGGGGISEVTGTAPISVLNGTTSPDISITAASADARGTMSAAHWTKLEGITAGAEPNEALDLGYTPAANNGTVTITGGGASTTIPAATTSAAGLMTATDKDNLDDIVANGSGIVAVVAGNGIDVNNDTAGAPVVSVIFGSAPNGTPVTVMPYDISMLQDLP